MHIYAHNICIHTCIFVCVRERDKRSEITTPKHAKIQYSISIQKWQPMLQEGRDRETDRRSIRYFCFQRSGPSAGGANGESHLLQRCSKKEVIAHLSICHLPRALQHWVVKIRRLTQISGLFWAKKDVAFHRYFALVDTQLFLHEGAHSAWRTHSVYPHENTHVNIFAPTGIKSRQLKEEVSSTVDESSRASSSKSEPLPVREDFVEKVKAAALDVSVCAISLFL